MTTSGIIGFIYLSIYLNQIYVDSNGDEVC